MSHFQKLLIIIGFIFILFGAHLFNLRYSPNQIKFSTPPTTTKQHTNLTPVKILIPKLKIENQIFMAKIEKGQWETTQKGVSFLSSSPVPGEKGNSIIYGHNFTNILGNLNRIKPGDEIQVVMSNGEKRIFIVSYTSIVNPTDVSILSETYDNRITVYTCYGFLDSKRFVATALLSNKNL